MSFRLDDLRSQVLWCSAESVGLVLDYFGKSKVCDFDVSLFVNQQVFWLKITVCDVHAMQILESKKDLAGEEESHVVGEATLSAQKGEQLSSTCVIEEHVDVRGCLEVPLEVDDEGMVYYGQHLLFTLHVVNLLELDDCTLLETFKSKGICVRGVGAVLDQSHSAEGSRPEG